MGALEAFRFAFEGRGLGEGLTIVPLYVRISPENEQKPINIICSWDHCRDLGDSPDLPDVLLVIKCLVPRTHGFTFEQEFLELKQAPWD